MVNTSDDFIKGAQHVMGLAMKEGQQLNHNFIGTEHILLALVADEDGIMIQKKAGRIFVA